MRVLRGLVVTFSKPTRVLSRAHATLTQRSFAETFGQQNRKCPLCGFFQSGDLLSPVSRRGSAVGVNVRTMAAFGGRDDDFIFRQLLDYKSFTYTYLLADRTTSDAVLIDPVVEMVNRDMQVVKDLGLNLIFAANTHVHADHITGTGEIKKKLPGCKSMIADVSGAKADVKLKHGDTIKFGKFELECRNTPGHTDGCMTFVWHQKSMVFTGDAILIRGCGRTDFQQGNPQNLYDSVHKQILSLPRHFMLFPAHDYTGQTMTTVDEELKYNPRLSKPKSDFVKIMKELTLPYPKQIDKALPANMVCGAYDLPAEATTN
ncbi:persulfide dioxygenase ETHE1, mitochondrial-like [Gigantopelta aegis]|uniref:persulfide dioxygenase ETHE1, mitochondrial-like n=1 Tax=Gigantopelta aegis TaxID=1735272 RepID=UPI001B88D262|nr:persulfide dioxygenase ETHE1, mitochondrial-like [Gigantopelta aegis]